MKRIALLAAAGLAASLAPSALADYTYPTFSLSGNRAATNTYAGLDLSTLGTAPAGTYVGFRIQLDWDSEPPGTSGSHAWSNEARVAFATAAGSGTGPTYPGGTTIYRAETSPTNGASNASDVLDLNFVGGFNSAYGGGANPLFWNYRQSFASTLNTVNWNNVRITLTEAVRPTCIDLGYLSSGASVNFNTEGTLPTTADTEIGVYDNNGNLLGSDDDAGTGNLSSLNLAGLADGTYYIAVGFFNTNFGAIGWNATSASTATGSIHLNVVSGAETLSADTASLAAGQVAWYCVTIPTPGTAGLLGLGALMAARRRRA